MKLELITVSKQTPSWVDAGYSEYAKRLPNEYQLIIKEIPPLKRTKNSDLPQITKKEGEKQLAAIAPGSHIIALDEHGKLWNTQQLAQQLQIWRENYQQVALLIGGPEGLAPECLARAHATWSLSPLTLPHHMVRIVVAEQLYRAWTILVNHPYHRI